MFKKMKKNNTSKDNLPKKDLTSSKPKKRNKS